jgi:hypothetical protein
MIGSPKLGFMMRLEKRFFRAKKYTSCLPLPPPSLHSVGDAQQGYLYPDHNPATGCGKLSSTCEAFFIEEGCFYECDHNLGKWRKHVDCDDESAENGWQIEGMPIKASYCDAWFEACKGPDNKLCMGVNSTVGKPQYGYFDQPTCHTDQGQGGCKRIDEVYSSGFHMCETLWQGSFKYETNANADAYVMTFTEDDVNPNNAKFTAKTYPDACPGKLGAINFTQAALEGCDAIPISYLKSYLGTSTSGASSSLRTSGSVFGTAAALVVAVSLLA